MKTNLTSSAIREMQAKNSPGMAKINRTDNLNCSLEYRVIGTLTECC